MMHETRVPGSCNLQCMNAPARKLPPPRRIVPPTSRPATLEDLFAIPGGERRHELIEGMIFEKGAASGEHGRTQRKVSAFIDPFDRPSYRIPGGWWIVTEVEVYFDEKNTLRPDLTGWRRERLPEGPRTTPVRVRPDWVCEILSTNRGNDLVKKKRVYHRHQVGHYWIIDPVERSLTVLRWGPDGYIDVLSAEDGELVYPEPFHGMPLLIGNIFGDDPDDDGTPPGYIADSEG